MSKHLLKDRKGAVIEAKCGLTFKGIEGATIWWTDVTCHNCRKAMGLATKRIVRRRDGDTDSAG